MKIQNRHACTAQTESLVREFENNKDLKPDLIKYTQKNNLLEIQIDSLHKLIRYVEVCRKITAGCSPLIFRGVSNTAYELIPSIMRDNFVDNRISADELFCVENRLLSEFKKRARPYLQSLPREKKWEWEWISLAQHHFLPTRLLDWTERAGTALFFAVEKKESHDKEAMNGCVWAIISPQEIDEKAITEPGKVDDVYLYRPPHVAPRITMQQGCFTVHPDNYMDRKIDWIDGPKIKFIIKSEDKSDIREGLYAAGINRAALFPDLDGIAMHLKETVSTAIKSCKSLNDLSTP